MCSLGADVSCADPLSPAFPVSVFVLALHREELGTGAGSLAFPHNPLTVCSELSLALNEGEHCSIRKRECLHLQAWFSGL